MNTEPPIARFASGKSIAAARLSQTLRHRNLMLASTRISDFWAWFSANAADLTSAYDSGDSRWLNAHVTTQVRKLAPDLNWEIGPYHLPERTFVLSPTRRENLLLTRSAVEVAPLVQGWRFLHAKPPKELVALTFMANDSTVHADNWLYQITAYKDGEFVDIEVYAPGSDGFPPGYEDLFCELVVESLIGEELRLERVGYVQPRTLSKSTDDGTLTQIQYLREHLGHVLTPPPESA